MTRAKSLKEKKITPPAAKQKQARSATGRQSVKVKKKRNTEEHDEQVKFFKWVRENTHRDWRLGMIFAIPNSGARSYATASYFKAEGMKKGVPDVCVPILGYPLYSLVSYAVLWIEFKARNGKLSQEQEAFHRGLWQGCHVVLVVTSADEAIEHIKDIFKL